MFGSSTNPRVTRVAQAIALAGLIGATTSAAAFDFVNDLIWNDGDRKQIPAAACHAAYPHQAASLTYGGDGAIRNISSTSVYVVCPFVTDRRFDDWQYASAQVEDRHPTTNVSCVFRATGDTGTAYSTQRTSGTPGKTSLAFENRNFQGDIGFAGRYVLRCSIPGKSNTGRTSALHGYYLSEGGGDWNT